MGRREFAAAVQLGGSSGRWAHRVERPSSFDWRCDLSPHDDAPAACRRTAASTDRQILGVARPRHAESAEPGQAPLPGVATGCPPVVEVQEVLTLRLSVWSANLGQWLKDSGPG
jgi:hypothetical protein